MSTDLMNVIPTDATVAVQVLLNDLLPKIKQRYVIVGSTATRFNLRSFGDDLDRPFNDIDLIADGPESFDTKMLQNFLVHHFHVDSCRSKFRIVLVHRSTGIRVDIFQWKPMNPGLIDAEFLTSSNEKLKVKVQDISTTFTYSLYELSVEPESFPVNRKKLGDVLAMEPYVYGPQVGRVWRELHNDSPPRSASEVFDDVVTRASRQKKSFPVEPWKSQDINYVCAKCAYSPEWPIAPHEQVLDLLGYIEIDGTNVYQPKKPRFLKRFF